MPTPTVTDFDPQSQAYYRDPQAALLPLLDDAPVFHHPPTGAYYVLRYADVREILSGDAFSNRSVKAVPVRDDLRARIPDEWARAAQVIHGGQANTLDPPAHTPQRRALQRTFTHKQVRRITPSIQATADELIDGLAERGACDLLEDFAAPLALSVVGQLMDLPPDVLPEFQEWATDLLGLLAPIDMVAADVRTPDDELVALFE